jgi:hypothetical protein
MDPVTISLAVGVASKAFEAIKSGFQMGRDLEQMSGDLSRWMGASSDIDQAEKQAKNPGVFGKVFGGGSIESVALNLTHGPQAYDELLAMEGKIRKERQETVYKQQQLRKQIGEVIAWLVVVAIIGGFAVLLVGVWINRAKADVDTQPKNFIMREESIED